MKAGRISFSREEEFHSHGKLGDVGGAHPDLIHLGRCTLGEPTESFKNPS